MTLFWVWYLEIFLEQRFGTPDVDPYRAFFLRGMRELGYVEGRNMVFEFRHYGDDAAAALLIMKALVQSKDNLIVTGDGAAILPRSR